MKHTTIRNAKRTSFLIADSPIWGKDQVISNTLRYNKQGLYDVDNEICIREAHRIAERGKCNNVRLVTVYHNAICNPTGIIGYTESKRTMKPFRFV